jgi:hypothetical protein
MGDGLMQQGPRPHRLGLSDKIIQTAWSHPFGQGAGFGHGLLGMGFKDIHVHCSQQRQ